MEIRFEPGDLVKIKYPVDKLNESKIGIVVDILTRSEQNIDWDRMLVLMDGWIDAFPYRRLKPVASK